MKVNNKIVAAILGMVFIGSAVHAQSLDDAKKAIDFYEDVTPVEQTQAFKSMFHAPLLKRDRGTGRPTKRDRREIDDLKDDFFEKGV